MEDCSEMVLKKLCCTCLSRDRKLSQLCRLKEGINNLYLLLSFDSEAYREGFYKDTANWYICWECWAVMERINSFRTQACSAQRQLSDIAEGRTDFVLLNACFSRLTRIHKTSYDETFVESDSTGDNFIDCGPDIKADSDEDIPLSLLHIETDDRIYTDEEMSQMNDVVVDNKSLVKSKLNKTNDGVKKKKKIKMLSKKRLTEVGNKKYFRTVRMDENEMRESRERRKLSVVYSNALFKCDSCVEKYKSQIDMDKHVLNCHVENDKCAQCDICLVFIKKSLVVDHKDDHYLRHECRFCDFVAYGLVDILNHMKSGHAMQNLEVPVKRKKGHRTTPVVLKPGSKPRQNQAMRDKRTPYGFLCTECNKYFDNKNQRWKHIQRHHKEGYRCSTCGKRFAFKNNLNRHEQMHQGPPPREKCPVCQKMIRVDLLKTHSRIHTDRDRYRCAECDKCFVSRASYEHHLKYTQAHTSVDILKYKCSMCDKGYRSRGELRDHVNYQHMDKTQHKCPVCGKALATRRCITRHVRRAHDGVKENARDKICQQCGKAFRDKKSLREHEFIHTGERPLSCEICGCTFRQSASLYTHKKRVHKIFPSRKNVTLVDTCAK